MATALDLLIVALEAGCKNLKENFDGNQIPEVTAASDTSSAAAVDHVQDDRNTVEDQMHSRENNNQNNRVALEIISDPEPEDYASSGSSWAPDQQSISESESELPLKKIETESMKNHSRQELKIQQGPALRTKTVLPRCWTPKRLLNKNAERRTYGLDKKNHNIKLFHKCITASEFHPKDQNVKIDNGNNKLTMVHSFELRTVKRELEAVRDLVQKLKTLSNNLARTLSDTREDSFHSQSLPICNYSVNRMTSDMLHHENEKNMNKLNQETPMTTGSTHNRTFSYIDETKKYKSRELLKTKEEKEINNQSGSVTPKKHKWVKKEKILNDSGSSAQGELKEMIPIGSGNTLVLKEVYCQINWKSYTMATRKLLMAVFSRRTLATHSLTGKASPAFLSKPAKLCLDPKKVADIVMTVTANCHVKEGLVRSAITTKCADENKMLKLQKQKDERRRTIEASIRSNDLQEND